MEVVVGGFALIVGLVSLVCWIWTIVRAFQEGETASGILSICPLVGFIIGRINSGSWNHTKVMIVWSICIVINILLNVALAGVLGGAAP